MLQDMRHKDLGYSKTNAAKLVLCNSLQVSKQNLEEGVPKDNHFTQKD